LCDAIEYFNFGPDLRAGRSGRDPSQVRPTLRWREPDSNHRSHERRPAWSWCRVSSRRLFRSPGIKQRRHEPSRTFRGRGPIGSNLPQRGVCKLSVPRTPLPEMIRRKSVAPRQGAEGQPVSRGARWEALRAALDRNRAARRSLVFGNVEIWCRKPVTDLSRGGRILRG